MDIKPIIDELQAADGRGARLRPRGRLAAAASPRPSSGDPDFAVPARGAQTASTSSSRSGSRACRSRGSSPQGTQERARRRRRSATCAFLLAGPARAGLLHADPHPGNFRLHRPTAASASSTSARSTGSPTACPRRWAAAHRRPSRATPRTCSPACARWLRQAVHRPRRRGAAGLPRARSWPAAHRHLHLQPGLAAGGVRHINDPRQPESRVGHEAQPAARVPADPPGLAGRDRCAVPDRGHRRRPGHGQCVDADADLPQLDELRSAASHRRAAPGRPRTRHHQAASSLASMLRRCARLQRSQVHTT